MTTLTHSEESLMKVLWKINSGYLRDIVEAYPEPKPHQNTISSFLKNLVEKHFLTATQEGRVFNYSVNIPEKDYQKEILKSFVQQYYQGSGSALLKDLLAQHYIEPTELSELFEVKVNFKTEAPKQESKPKKKKRKK